MESQSYSKALGVLACESDDLSVHLSRERLFVSHYQILESHGIKDEKIYPYLTGNDFFERHTGNYNSELSRIIKTLNDSYNFTFKEIGEFLDVTFDL